MSHVIVAGDPGVVPQLGTDERDDHVEILDTFDGGHSINKLMYFSLLPDKLKSTKNSSEFITLKKQCH